jgi:hypothetical protein
MQMKMPEKTIQTKSAESAKNLRKCYTTPKLTVLGKLERLTAGSGAVVKPVCIGM